MVPTDREPQHINHHGTAFDQGKKQTIVVILLISWTYNNNNRDLFYVITLFLYQLLGKVDPCRWHFQQSRDNAAARVRRYECLNDASADAGAKG